MGERNHLSAPGAVGQTKGRWTMLLGGTVAAVLATGMLMQYVRSPASKAATEPSAGQARVGSSAKKPEVLARVDKDSITYDTVAEECVKRYGREVLDDLIHRLIIQQACEANQINVSEQEISDEIGRIEKDINEAFVRNYGPRVKARMIMFDNQRRAQAGWDQLKNNPDEFEALAAKLSIDPNSRALGGQIPPIPRFNGNEQLENAAFRLKKDEISGVIEVGPSRYVVLKCEGRTEPVVTDIDEVKSVLYDELKESKIQADVAKIFEKLKKETIVDNYLTQTSNRPERNASASGPVGGAVQPTGGTQSKQNSAPTRSPNAAAPAKASRN